MPLTTITNNRKGTYTLLRPKHKDITLKPGESITEDLGALEIANAEYEGVDVRKADAKSGGNGKAASKSGGNGQKADAKSGGNEADTEGGEAE